MGLTRTLSHSIPIGIATAAAAIIAAGAGSHVVPGCPDAHTPTLDLETDPPLAEETVLRALYGGAYRDGHLTWSPAERGAWPDQWQHEAVWKKGEPLATDVVASLSMRSAAGNRQYAVLTSTEPESWIDDIPGHPAAPVLGSAVLRRTGKNWLITSCQRSHGRMGSYGDMPEPDTVVLGPTERHTGFLFEPGYTAQGITTESLVIYAVVDGSVDKVLEISDAYKSGRYGNEKVDYSTKLEIVPNGSDGFYDIVARKEGTTAERITSGEEPEWEVEPVSEVTRYTFEGGEYIEIE